MVDTVSRMLFGLVMIAAVILIPIAVGLTVYFGNPLIMWFTGLLLVACAAIVFVIDSIFETE